MNKRRMKYNSYARVRNCIDILNGKMTLIHELPPGSVFMVNQTVEILTPLKVVLMM